MRKLIKSLPALGLALAASMAFAFNMPVQQDQFARHPETGQWMNITSLEEGEDYRCLQSGECTYDAPDGNVIKQGRFVILD